MQDNKREKSISMTEEEALGLLEMAMRFQGELSQEQILAIGKLTELCRSYYRESGLNVAGSIRSNAASSLAA